MNKGSKRKNRASIKAKQTRVAKQHKRDKSNQNEIIRISPLIEAFFTCIGKTDDCEKAISAIKQFTSSQCQNPTDDIEMYTAIIYVQYMNWVVGNNNSIDSNSLIMSAANLVEFDLFKSMYNSFP